MNFLFLYFNIYITFASVPEQNSLLVKLKVKSYKSCIYLDLTLEVRR